MVLKSGISEGFCLVDDTAISIKYGHRHSEDFDFFTAEFPKKRIELFLKKVVDMAQVTVTRATEGTVELLIEGIRFSFLEYPYVLLKPTEEIPGIPGLKLASDEDIAAMKAVAIAQRGEKKDFYDLWFLMRQRDWGLSHVIALCTQKYGSIFSPSHFLRAAVYFEDAEKEKSSQEIEEKWQEVKDFFAEQVEREITSGMEPG